MSKTMSIAASTTWGPERKHLAAVVAALIGVAWALSFAGPAQARVILNDTSAREFRSYDISSLQASIGEDRVARTDIEAVRAQNYRITAQTQESMLPQEVALREAARGYGDQQFEPPAAGTEIEVVRAENFKFEAPETQVAEIADGVNVGLLTAVTVGLLGVALLAGGMRHRRGVSPA